MHPRRLYLADPASPCHRRYHHKPSLMTNTYSNTWELGTLLWAAFTSLCVLPIFVGASVLLGGRRLHENGTVVLVTSSCQIRLPSILMPPLHLPTLHHQARLTRKQYTRITTRNGAPLLVRRARRQTLRVLSSRQIQAKDFTYRPVESVSSSNAYGSEGQCQVTLNRLTLTTHRTSSPTRSTPAVDSIAQIDAFSSSSARLP